MRIGVGMILLALAGLFVVGLDGFTIPGTPKPGWCTCLDCNPNIFGPIELFHRRSSMPDIIHFHMLALLVVGGMIVAASFTGRATIRDKQYPFEKARCLACGYELKGIKTGICPECGTEFDIVEKSES
ncbi:MAG: hypothetical protein AAGB48_07755 [Planctomycetota bacterium]